VELEAANHELEVFSYSVSHDLRSPLRAVNAFSHDLREGFSPQLPSEAQELLNRVISNAQRMAQIIEDLLRFSQLSRQEVAKQPVLVLTIVHALLDELRREHQNDCLSSVRRLARLHWRPLVAHPGLCEPAGQRQFTRAKGQSLKSATCARRAQGLFLRDNG
jgi:light-regulated signal transduction histidine kinase (bacteriophytochrome)